MSIVSILLLGCNYCKTIATYEAGSGSVSLDVFYCHSFKIVFEVRVTTSDHLV